MKLVRAEQPQLGVAPADQRLHAEQGAVARATPAAGSPGRTRRRSSAAGIAADSAYRVSSRSLRSGSNSAHRPLPDDFAQCRVMSAARISSAGVVPATGRSRCRCSRTRSVRARRCARALAIAASAASATLSTSSVQVVSSTRMTNSSPPSRATRCSPTAWREPLRDRDQQLVADLVAERVVDHLEPVQVDEADAEPAVPVAGVGRTAGAEPLGEQGAVGQVGQRVVGGLVPEPGLAVAQRPLGLRPGRPCAARRIDSCSSRVRSRSARAYPVATAPSSRASRSRDAPSPASPRSRSSRS